MKRLYQLSLIAVLSVLLVLAGYISYNIHQLAHKRALIRYDYSDVNGIDYGLLSANAWKNGVQEIITNRIQDFSISPDQEKVLKAQIDRVLNSMITQADSLIQKGTSFSGKVTKFAVNSFVNLDKVRANVPYFTESIVHEIKKPKNLDKLKGLVQEKVDEYAVQTYDSISDTSHLFKVLHKYGTNNTDDFNVKTESQIDTIQNTIYVYTFIIIGIMVFFLLLWFVAYNKLPELRKPLFVMSVLLAVIVLLVGLTTPMIEIDARIKQLDFMIMGQNLEFKNQIIFYQSKSILQVVEILVKTKKPDSVFVGILILAFSILFPFTKLISTNIYLMGGEKIKQNKFIKYFAFKSGKWSMADVTVVAIFMAYIGFKGILDSQMDNLTIKTSSYNSIATNLTTLQPGFILFLSFVLYGLILSEILKHIEKPSL